MNGNKPWFWPDTQGFLAIAIVVLLGSIVFILLLHPIQIDDRIQGVLMTVIGVLVGSLKDVYSFFFGSSKGSVSKDDTIAAVVTGNAPIINKEEVPTRAPLN